MGKYWQFLLASYHIQIIYRGAMIIRGFRDTINVLFFIVLWASIYTQKETIGGFTFQAMVTYYILVKIIDQLYSYEPSRLVSRDIKQGDLSNYLIKPLKYFFYLVFYTLGRRLARITVSLLIIAIVFIVFPRWVSYPPSQIYFLSFVVSALISWLLLFELAFLIGSFSFWISEASGLRTAMEQTILVLGGQWVPLSLFPEPIARILEKLPFRYLYFQLVQIYQGKIPVSELGFQLYSQSLWALLLAFLCYFVWIKGIKRYDAYGR